MPLTPQLCSGSSQFHYERQVGVHSQLHVICKLASNFQWRQNLDYNYNDSRQNISRQHYDYTLAGNYPSQLPEDYQHVIKAQNFPTIQWYSKIYYLSLYRSGLTYTTCKWSADWSGAPSLICSAYCCHLSLQGKTIITVIVCLWPLSCVLVAHSSITKDRWRSTVNCNSFSEFLLMNMLKTLHGWVLAWYHQGIM